MRKKDADNPLLAEIVGKGRNKKFTEEGMRLAVELWGNASSNNQGQEGGGSAPAGDEKLLPFLHSRFHGHGF